MSLIMPDGSRTINWGLPGAAGQRQQMPISRGPEQLAWQQQNPSQSQAKPAGGFSAWSPGQAQSQQSPYSAATPYGQHKPQHQADNPWNPGGTNQQQTRQMDLSQYMSPGSPLPGTSVPQASPGGAAQQMPQWGQYLPFGGQNAGIPPFQFRATDFMGNQFSDPGAFTAQQGAMAQALNQQRAQGIGQGQFGPLNPQLAYQQGAEMVQGGWQNPFAAQGPRPERGPRPTTENQRLGLSEYAYPLPAFQAPAQGGWQSHVPAVGPAPTTENQIRTLIGPPPTAEGGQAQVGPMPKPSGSVNQTVPLRPVLMAPGSPGGAAPPPEYDGTNQSIRPTGNGYVPQRGEYGWDSGGFGDVLFERPDAPPGQRFDAAAFEAKKRSLLDASAAAARSGNSQQAQQLRSQADRMVENLPVLRAKANRDKRALNAAIKDQQLKQSASNTAKAPATVNQGDRPGDRIVGGFNYSAAQREYEAAHKKRVQAPANKKWLASLSPANRGIYGLMQRY